jgi:uncharacterized membrane protein YeaQ/YmgE (transglycosylase-associated protein family)
MVGETARRLPFLPGTAARLGAGVVVSPEEYAMTMSLPGLLLLILIAAVCGAVGKAIAGSARGGLIVTTALGFIGALIGPWVAHLLKLPEPFVITIDRHPFPILWAIIGAALFVALIHLVSRRR